MSIKNGSATILELTAENVKRLSVVKIKADGSPVVVIAGENEQGKSTVQDCILMGLGGKESIPAKPIRKGQTHAHIRLDLGDYIVTRTFTPTGTALKVTNREGHLCPSPQALLDGLLGAHTLDPVEFERMDDTAQAATLRQLAGIDTTDLDLERKQVFDERTLVNRDVTQVQGALAKAPRHEDAGLKPVDATAVATELTAADEAATKAANASAKATAATLAVTAARHRADAATETVERARKALEDAETASLEADEALQNALEAERAAKATAAKTIKAVPDRAMLRQRMADVDAINSKIRDNQARAQLEQQLREKKGAAEALTTKLHTIDSQKAEQLASARFPVEGLGLDEFGVTWNGLPFAQAATSVRLRVSVAIALALKPALKVLLIRNGNDLGKKNLQLLAEMAKDAGAQLWIEKIVSDGSLPTVVIEDGTVVSSNLVGA